MAEQQVGTTFVKVVPDIDRAAFQAEIDKVTAGVKVEIPVTFKIAPGATTALVKTVQTEFDKRKALPRLPVRFKVARGAVTELVALSQKQFDRRKALPRLSTRLVLAKGAVAEVSAEAQTAVTAAGPVEMRATIKTGSLLTEVAAAEALLSARINTQFKNMDKLAATAAKKVAESNKARIASTVEMLDEIAAIEGAKGVARAEARVYAARRLIEEQAELSSLSAGVARERAEATAQGRINALIKEGLDQRALTELRAAQSLANRKEILEIQHANKVAFLYERADLRKQESSRRTLRQLRNDLGQFDATTTRILRGLGIGYAAFTASVVAGFGAIAVASLKSFAETENQLRRTAAVLGTDVFSKVAAETKSGEEAFAAFNAEVNRTDQALRGVVNDVALATVFDPTEIATGTRALAQAGLGIEAIQQSLKGVAQFAQNEELLPEEAVANLVQGATAAGVSLNNLTDLSDKFTFVANNTTATATEVAEAFANRAAPAFNAYGESVSSTLTVLDLFAAAGIRGKGAGEQVGILIREINKASTKTPATTAAFKKYGIEIGKVNGVQVPFLETLGQLGTVLDNVRTTKGSQELARIRKELGLTEKSGAGLLQILPQITKDTGGNAQLAIKNLKNLQDQIESSTGSTQRQADVITNTLSFQTELLLNQFQTLFKDAAGPLGRELTKVFQELNGDLEGTSDIASGLRQRFLDAGQAVSDVIAPAVRRFATGADGADFFGGVVKSFKLTLTGLREGFVEFRNEVFGRSSDRGFFSVLGEGFAAIGRFSEEFLPLFGRTLGIVVSLVKENTEAFELFIKAGLGLLAFSKILRLFLIPLTSVNEQIQVLRKGYLFLTGASAAQSLTQQAAAMSSLNTATKATAASTNALAAAETRLAAANAAETATSGVPGGGKLLGRLGELGKAARGPAALTAAIALGIPALVGFGQGAARSTGEVDNLSVATGGLTAALGSLKPALEGLANPIKTAQSFGDKLGQSFREATASLLDAGVAVTALGAGDLDSFEENTKSSLDRATLSALRFGDALIFDSVQDGGYDLVNFGLQADRLERKLNGDEGLAGAIDSVTSAVGRLRTATNRGIESAFAKEQERWNRAVSVSLRFMPKQFAQTGTLTALQKALGLSLSDVAERGRGAVAGLTSMQARAANVAYATKVLTGAVKDQAAFLEIARTATNDYQQNLVRLYGSELRLEKQLELVSQGNQRAAKQYVANVRLATLEATAVKKLELQLARTTLARLRDGVAERQGLRSSQVVAAAKQFAEAKAAAEAADADAAEQIKSAEQLVADLQKSVNEGAGGGGGGGLNKVAEDIKDAATLAAEAVNKLSAAQFKLAADSLIARIAKVPGVYKATVREAAVLQRALPLLDAALEKQRAEVTKLDEALQSLQSTQLAGTKAAADEAFGFDQQVKALQLQRVDLQIAGASDEDQRIADIDAQIASIQLKSERASLAASLALDPLKKTLEETFNPVKELSFDQIISQFQALNQQKLVLDARVNTTESLKAKLEAVVAGAADQFAGVGLNVTKGISVGLAAGQQGVVNASRTTANAITNTIDTTLGIASPSRVMIQRGQFIDQGLAAGIVGSRNLPIDAIRGIRTAMLLVLDNGMPLFEQRGGTIISSFLAGMRKVYTEQVQPFVLDIATWIKDNKGPISYDAQLLRPAGEAMMSGFHGGLRDGFSEVKGWVKGVAGTIGDNFPKELLFERSARFLLNNAKADATFTAEDAFNSLIPAGFESLGTFDPTLSFLHKTLSLADTTEMARKLIAGYAGMNVSSVDRAAGTRTAAGFISDHTFGTAADLGTGSARPTAASLELFDKLKPLVGTIFKQLIHNGIGLNANGGTFADSAHYDHIHAAFLQGKGFDKFSGKKGLGSIAIPGVSQDILQAISTAATQYKVDPFLIAAVMKQESGFRKNVVSFDGGYGLMQLTSKNLVAAADAIGGRTNPLANTLIGTQYLSQLISQLGSVRLGLSAYNSGPGGGERYGRVDVPNYVSSVLAIYEELMRKYGNGMGVGTFRAQGGGLNAGQASWVGESGREIFIPDRPGQVITNRNVESMIRAMENAQTGGGVTQPVTNITNNVRSNSDSAAVVAALTQAQLRAQTVGVRR